MILNPTVIADIKGIINTAKDKAIRTVDTQRVLMYWQISQRKFIEEQEGKDVAAYGKFSIASIFEQLQPEFRSGFSKRYLETCLQFYRVFPIAHAVRAQLTSTHFKLLIRLENHNSMEFYIAETAAFAEQRSGYSFCNCQNNRRSHRLIP